LTHLLSLKVEQSFQDLNLIYCELTSLLVFASDNRLANNSCTGQEKSRQNSVSTQTSEGILSLQAERVSKYIVQLLQGEVQSGSQVGRPLTPVAYTGLLPTIWSLLNRPSLNEHQIASSVFRATLEHAIKASSVSAVKKLAIEFVARLILVSLFALPQTL
jgi:pre-rRNA-processing protein IPI1